MKSEKEIIKSKTTMYIPTNEPSKCITQKIRNFKKKTQKLQGDKKIKIKII